MFDDQQVCRSMDEIEMKLDNLRLMGMRVVKINLTNVTASENTSLTDILLQNPQVTSLGIGIGVPDTAIEPPRTPFEAKPVSKLYNIEHVRNVVMQYNPLGTIEIPIPKNTQEFTLNLSIGKPTGVGIGQYLSRVVAGKCAPTLVLAGMDNVEIWEGFKAPGKVTSIRLLGARRNLPSSFTAAMREDGFERTSREDNGVTFTRKTDNGETTSPP